MSSFNRMIVKQMAKTGSVKIIPGNVTGHISPYTEWMKWLSYEPEFLKKRIEILEKKPVSLMTDEELKEISEYKKNRMLVKLFEVYGTCECSKENYMKVYDYMCNQSIEDLMLSKLTYEELNYAKKEINRLRYVPKEELSDKIQKEKNKENFAKLSMIDSYILHMISNIDYARNIHKLDKEISKEVKRNEVIRQKSLVYASNPYLKK